MENKILRTYALLAHLKETHGSNIGGLIDIFIPIVKKSLSEYSRDHDHNEIKGKSTLEIQRKIQSYFGIEIPNYILGVIFKEISKEINNESVFCYYTDTSFIVKTYIFSDLDDYIDQETKNIELLQNDYEKFCSNNNYTYDFEELEKFILAQKLELFSTKNSSFLDVNCLIPRYIKSKFEDPVLFKIISDLYLGSLISVYLEFEINSPVTNTELLLDTNFFISLIDLNTEEAYNTCIQLYELCSKMGFRFSILYSTVEQIKILLTSRINDFSNKDIGLIREADVFGACVRRNLDKTQLERIKDRVNQTLQEYKIDIIHEAQIKNLIIEAKNSANYKELKSARNNEPSALNDAVAYLYVKKKRNNNPSKFSEVNCWFLHNSYLPDYDSNLGYQIHQRNTISANELLTLLWLSNPSQTKIDNLTMTKGGLGAYVTKYRSVKIPSNTTLKLIKEKAVSALKIGKINEVDIYNISTRMAEGYLTNGDADRLANSPDDDFIDMIKKISNQECDLASEISDQKKLISELDTNLKRQLEETASLKRTIANVKFDSAINDYEAKCAARINSEYTDRLTKMKTTAYIYILATVIVSLLWNIVEFYNKSHSVLFRLLGFVLWFVSMFGIKFVDHKSIFKCFKILFCKKSRQQLEGEVSSSVTEKFQQEFKKPQLTDFEK